MSSIIIQDLASKRELDTGAMTRARGGFAMPNVNVNVNLDQKIGQFQNIQVNVLNNNGVIGAGFTAPSLSLSPVQWGANNAAIPV
ncbi:MAG: hypothetical protein ACXWC4_03490 [Telluria sp.]